MSSNPQPTTIYQEDVPRRHAPIASTGVLGWLRANLFRTWFDGILTVVATLFLISVIVGFVEWTIGSANWYSVLRNLSNLMVGSLQASPEALARVNLMTLLLAFGVGVSLRAWSRVGLRGWLWTAGLSALFVVIPALTSTLPLPPSVVTVGDISVVSGSVTEAPQPTFAFIGQAGEVVRVGIADEAGQDDQSLASISAFGDRAADALINAARVQVAAQTRLAEIENLLADESTLAGQRALLTSERDNLTEDVEVITERYALNTADVAVRLLAADGETVLVEAVLSPGGEGLIYTLPDNGWYILDSAVQAEETNALLTMQGIYPVLERSITRTRLDADGGAMVSRTGQTQTESFIQHVRLTDDFTTEDAVPRIGGEDVTRYLFVNNQYRGVRDLTDYLVLHFGPFFERTGRAVLPSVGLVALGYLLMHLLDKALPPVPPAPKPSRRIAFWMWFAMPFVVYFIIAGTDPRSWGGLFLTFLLTAVGIVLSFPIGVLLALGRRADDLPVVKYFCILVIEFVRGVPLITVLFIASLALPLVNPALSEVPGAVRAMVAITIFSAAYLAENVRGGLQSIPPGQVEAAKALGMNPVQVTLRITLPQALRAVIPALVGQCISLFKDTSLVAIVGLADLTRIADIIVAQAEYIGLRRETYLFVAALYFVFSFAMAYVSRKIELSGSGAARQVQL